MPPSSTPSTPGRISRIASKPLKLAASALHRSSSSTRVSSGEPSLSASTSNGDGRPLPTPQRSSSSGNENASVPKAARGPRKPLDGEEPAAWIRVRVVKGEDLVAKDRAGTSDP